MFNNQAESHSPPPFGDLSGRRVVVTGASTGIGRAIALETADAGADVLVHYARNSEAAESLAEEVRSRDRQSQTLAADFRDPAALEQFTDRVRVTFGRCDRWVLNAGADLLTTSLRDAEYGEKLHALYEVDIRGSLLLGKAVCEDLRASGGSVVTIGWDQAERGMGGDSGELFAAGKNAVMGASRSLAVSYAPHVRVNCIAPGWIRTAWGESAPQEWQDRVLAETPLGRWGEPEDIARLARFLLSDSAAYITGQVIYANGGAER